MGWYDKAGIELDLQPGKGSVGSIGRVSTGGSQLGLADMAVVLTALGKGASVTAVFDIYADVALGMLLAEELGHHRREGFPRQAHRHAAQRSRGAYPEPAAAQKLNGIDPGERRLGQHRPERRARRLK